MGGTFKQGSHKSAPFAAIFWLQRPSTAAPQCALQNVHSGAAIHVTQSTCTECGTAALRRPQCTSQEIRRNARNAMHVRYVDCVVTWIALEETWRNASSGGEAANRALLCDPQFFSLAIWFTNNWDTNLTSRHQLLTSNLNRVFCVMHCLEISSVSCTCRKGGC